MTFSYIVIILQHKREL